MKLISNIGNGLFLLEKKSFNDERGIFQRIFCPDLLKEYWRDRKICQVNRSVTHNVGAFRGFHFQKPPYCEMKFVQCTSGKVLDYAIDLRAGSSTFLQVYSFELSAENNICAIIPEGFAHGFQVLEPNSELVYFASAPYSSEYEDGINYQDPSLGITLPLPLKEISLRDQNFKFLDKNYKGIQL